MVVPNDAGETCITSSGLFMQTLYLPDYSLPVNVIKANPTAGIGHCQNLFLIIPGNPGLVKYYEDFAKSLFDDLDDGKTAVWAISHACHSINVPFEKDAKLCNENPLDIEIEHKMEFIEQQVPPNCGITLIGHSIGCYMILSILLILQGLKIRKFCCPPKSSSLETSKNYLDVYSRIKHCYFLFPTIERMKDSPNGKKLWPVLKYFQSIAIFLITVLNWLPLSLKTKICQWVLGRKGINSTMISATNELLTPKIFRNMLKLAFNELNVVNDLDIREVLSVKDKLIFYFGKTDEWCPLSYRDKLLLTVPSLKNYVDDLGIEHAFVLKSSAEMLAKLITIIRERTKKDDL